MAEKKQKTLNIRLSLTEKEQLDKLAKDKGLKVSDYVRSILFSDVIQDDVQSNEDVMHILKTELEEKISKLKTFRNY